MKFVVDTHTHTIASGHAYTTLLENIKEASIKGIKLLGTTDHGPNMPGGPNEMYFRNFKVLPRKLYGVRLIYGCEANIIDYNGTLDLSESTLKNMDIIIASLHDVCIKPGTIEENTRAVVAAMDNGLVDIIGHLGNPTFPVDIEEVVHTAKSRNVIIEINNGSFVSRTGSEENCIKVARMCKELKVNVILGSDAHTCYQIGGFKKAEIVLSQVNMPESLIINTDCNKLLSYLKNKGKLSI